MSWIKNCFIASTISTFGYLLLVNTLEAQIIPDSTLPSNSIVSPQANVSVITGGSVAGGNLFHSFREFSILSGSSALFNNSTAIQNIISRVTGNSGSLIDGKISANGNANLFLINPNGIIFGRAARLDIGGSFLASTADSLKFGNGIEFSAIAPASNPLLSVNVPMGLQFGNNPSNIVSRAQGDGTTGLTVKPGKTLALVGGDISLEGGFLLAPQGRIELGGVADRGLVSLSNTAQGLVLGYENVRSFRDILLTQSAFASTTGEGGGNIQVQGRQIAIAEGSGVSANTRGALPGGTLAAIASESIEIFGKSTDDFLSNLTAAVEQQASGNGGNVRIQTNRLILRDGGQIFTATLHDGNAGNLIIDAKSVELSGSVITADGEFVSGLFASSQSGASGNGGDITINSDRIEIKDGAQVVSTAFSSGNAGSITVNAREIELSGTNPRSPAGVSGFKASAEVDSTGNGGNLNITTGKLIIRDGAEAQVSTLSSGNAGSLTVRADSIELIGKTFNGQFASALRAVSGLEGIVTDVSGAGGDLSVTTRDLIVRDGADILVSATGTGAAGNLAIAAESIRLNNQSALRAETKTGDRGNITIQAQDLQLRHDSAISTNSVGTATGGNININTGVLVGLENSDITANSIASFGGQVNVQAQSIFGIASRDATSLVTSDITASSALGAQFSGTVDIKTPDVDPSKGLVTLSVQPIDASRLIAQRCLRDRRSNEFLITGRGGLPPNPNEILSANRVLEDLGGISNKSLVSLQPAINRQTEIQSRPLSTIIEAQTWDRNSNGEITLVAAARIPKGIASSAPHSNLPRCNSD